MVKCWPSTSDTRYMAVSRNQAGDQSIMVYDIKPSPSANFSNLKYFNHQLSMLNNGPKPYQLLSLCPTVVLDIWYTLPPAILQK